MKPVSVNAFVDITVEDIAKSITPEELGDLFCELCKYTAQGSFENRRRIIGQIADGLHEDAIRMLGEVVALAYHRVKIVAPEPMPSLSSLPPSVPSSKDDMDAPF